MNETECLCPICHEPLVLGPYFSQCQNPKCKKTEFISASKRVWQELGASQIEIAKKTKTICNLKSKLSVAQWWLDRISVLQKLGLNTAYFAPLWASEAIKQINQIEGE